MTYKNIIKTEKEYTDIKKACEISVDILRELRDATKLGVSPRDLDDLCGELIAKRKVKSSFKGVPGFKNPFPSNLCIMVNEEAVHAIPNSTKGFENGDIVKIDMGIIYEGFNTDHGITIGIGDILPREKIMIEVVKYSVREATKKALPGKRTGDVASVLGEIVSLSGFDSISGFAGHGIGKNIHYSPNVPFFGEAGRGEIFQENMLMCIENWISNGDASLRLEKDGWTLRTHDGSKTAMYEHMIIIRKGSPEILTNFD